VSANKLLVFYNFSTAVLPIFILPLIVYHFWRNRKTSCIGTIYLDGNKIASGKIKKTNSNTFGIDESADVGVDENTPVPTEYLLSQNYQNPFNSSSVIKYSIPKLSQVTLKIINTLGEEIETLVKEEKPIGTYELNWNAVSLPSGVYFYRLQAGDFVQTKKMILLK